MKLRSRTVHFYDLLIESSTRHAKIDDPSCADIQDVLQIIFKQKLKGLSVTEGRNASVEVADTGIDTSRNEFHLLLNHADTDVSDVTFKDFSTKNRRKGGKKKIEGLEYSCHVLIKTSSNRRSALMLMTMGSGVNSLLVERFFSKALKLLKESGSGVSIFEFPHPSNEHKDGKPVTYTVGYTFRCAGHKSVLLEDALRKGEFSSLELIAPDQGRFDAGGNLQIQEYSVEVKAVNPKIVSWAAIQNATRIFRKTRTDHAFSHLRVRYRQGDETKSSTFELDNLDAAMVKKEKISFDTDVQSQQDRLNQIIITGMREAI